MHEKTDGCGRSVRRGEATPDRLIAVILRAGAPEIDVLRLLADGHDTGEIARQLSFSERTVKNVVHDVTTRLQLRNRSHAVANASREGWI